MLADPKNPAPVLNAAQSDPQANGIMQGFPPPADKTLRFNDGSSSRFPGSRWAFSHTRELLPTANVWRGDGPVSHLPRNEHDLTNVALTTMDGVNTTFGEALQLTYTDAIVVLHKGTIVFEKYFGEGNPRRPHIAMSVTKSFIGTLAAMLVHEGKLDETALVTKYLPEMQGTAYADATIRQVMDMTIGVKYSENYADPSAEIFDYSRAGGMSPRRPDYAGPKCFYEFLVTLKKEGEHGKGFTYKTVNTEVLGWILRRVTGMNLADALSSMVWSKLGAEHNADIVVDSIGTEMGGGGLCTTLRDLARFGETMRNNGRFNDQQIIPAAVVADIAKGASQAHFATAGYNLLPGWSYRNMWWNTHNEHGAYTARGIHGQCIYVDPKAEMTIARYGSHPIAANAGNDPVSLPAYMAVAKALIA